MGIESVRKKFESTTGKKILKYEKTQALEALYKKHLGMANGFFKERNYSLSYFEYYRSLKAMALFYLQKKLGDIGEIGEDEAVELVANRDYFKLKKKDVEGFSKNYEAIINRKKITRRECSEIRDIVKKVEREI